jgi:hypothetical protein
MLLSDMRSFGAAKSKKRHILSGIWPREAWCYTNRYLELRNDDS